MPADYSAINTTLVGQVVVQADANNVLVLEKNRDRRGLYIRNVSHQASLIGGGVVDTALVFVSFNVNKVCVPWKAKLLEPGEIYTNNWLDMYQGPVTIAVLGGPAAILIEEAE